MTKTYFFTNPNNATTRGTLEIRSKDIAAWYERYASCDRECSTELEMVDALADAFGATVTQN